MSATSKFLSVPLLLLLVCGSSGRAWGQSRPERPYRGLFDQGGVSQSEQSVSVNGSVGGGYDSSIAADASEAGLGGGATPRTQSPGGSYVLVAGGLSYSLSKKRISLSASEGSSARYYPTFAGTFAVSHSAALGVGYTPSDRTSFNATQTLTYQPFSLFSLFPQLQPPGFGQIVSTDLDYSHNSNPYFTYTGGVGFTRQLSRRSSLAGGYDYQRYAYSGQSVSDFTSHGAFARYTHSLKAGSG